MEISTIVNSREARRTLVEEETLLRRRWSGPLDPIIPAEQKGFNSKRIIDACRPYEWRDKFPAVVRSDSELPAEVEKNEPACFRPGRRDKDGRWCRGDGVCD